MVFPVESSFGFRKLLQLGGSKSPPPPHQPGLMQYIPPGMLFTAPFFPPAEFIKPPPMVPNFPVVVATNPPLGPITTLRELPDKLKTEIDLGSDMVEFDSESEAEDEEELHEEMRQREGVEEVRTNVASISSSSHTPALLLAGIAMVILGVAYGEFIRYKNKRGDLLAVQEAPCLRGFAGYGSIPSPDPEAGNNRWATGDAALKLSDV